MTTFVIGQRRYCWFIALVTLAFLPCAAPGAAIIAPEGLEPQWQAVPLVPQAVLDAGIRPGGEGGHAGSAAFPLKPSTDGRYLMDARTTPFFVHADTAWQAPKRLSLKEFAQYLDHRAGLGSNTVMLHTFSKEVTPVSNLNGDRPFEPIDDITKPVEAYWRHLDAMLDLAERRSFLVMIAPLWIRWGGDDRQGWRNQLTEANAPVYGQWLGRRYTERKNVVWILGGDANPGEKTAAINALGRALKAAAPHHLLCVHNAPENSSTRYFGDSGWLDINLAYTYRETHVQVLGEWSRTGKIRPIVLGESGYEEESNDGRDGTPWRVRRQAYGAVLSGSLGGHAFGQKHLWRMDDQWRQAMDSPGSKQMAYVKQLFATRAWWQLRPDERGELVTAGRGKPGENTWVSAAITDDRTLGIIYLPKSQPIKVNLDRMAVDGRKSVRAQWMDPLDGRMLSIEGSPSKAEGEHDFVPPARNAGEDTDWVLLLEAEVPAAARTNSLEQQWEPVPLVTKEVLDAGYRPGGEGGQWPQAIAIDPVDGEFLLYGTDVGGIFRSLDGGKSFEPCNRGYTPRGNCGFAIDPVNINRALAIGANSLEMDCHGIYLTTDHGASWTHVLPKRTKGYRDFREQVAFDRSSYDAGAGCCKVAYWSAAASSADATGRLYKSVDGGKTWAEVANSKSLGNGIVKVHPAKGYVYVANSGGLFMSRDGGRSLAKKVQDAVTGLDVVATQPDMVFACKVNESLVSRDAGETFISVTPGGLPGKRNLVQIRVSPANVNRMMIENNQGDYQWQKYYSTDGGKTWALAKQDNRLAILPYNPRQPMFAMHPTDEQVAWSFGGDWITRTADGGATWAWANNGNNGIMVGGRFNFNVQNPDLLYFTAVDYNGALTTDGGKTWTYINLSQIHWGGSVSAGYAATPQILYGVMDNRLRMTRDGGKTFTNVGGVSQYGARVSYGAPTDPNILFCCNLRSTDQGEHWAPMNGCDGVFTSSPVGDRELYGRNGRSLVKSADKGATWAVLAALPGRVGDVAYDHVRNRVYATSNEKLYQYDVGAGALKEITPAIPADQFGARRTHTVAVDPVDPSVVYVGGARDVYSTDTAVVRSTDAGQTWQSLIRSVRVDNVKTGPDGGREAIAIRVHPKTRYAYVGTGCYGFWKFGPPAARRAEQ